MTTTTTAELIDQRVTYRGSLTDCHGPAVVVGYCECQECWDLDLTRYVLHPGTTVPYGRGRVLSHVRRESFTTD